LALWVCNVNGPMRSTCEGGRGLMCIVSGKK
jgi:hypothetical protein